MKRRGPASGRAASPPGLSMRRHSARKRGERVGLELRDEVLGEDRVGARVGERQPARQVRDDVGPARRVEVDVDETGQRMRARTEVDERHPIILPSRVGDAARASPGNALKKYMCLICGFIYEEEFGLPGRGHPARDDLGQGAAELDLPGVRRAQGRFRDGRVLGEPACGRHSSRPCAPHDAPRRRPPAVDRLLHERARHEACCARPTAPSSATRSRSSATATSASTRCSSSPTTTASTATTSAPRTATSRSRSTTRRRRATRCARRAATVTRDAGPVKGGTTVIAFVQDPDGYKIELIEQGRELGGRADVRCAPAAHRSARAPTADRRGMRAARPVRNPPLQQLPGRARTRRAPGRARCRRAAAPAGRTGTCRPSGRPCRSSASRRAPSGRRS